MFHISYYAWLAFLSLLLGRPPRSKRTDILFPYPALFRSQFAAYDSSVSADTVVARLRDAQLPAYREASRVGDKQAWRVRIGPYATRADAEIARVEIGRAHV